MQMRTDCLLVYRIERARFSNINPRLRSRQSLVRCHTTVEQNLLLLRVVQSSPNLTADAMSLNFIDFIANDAGYNCLFYVYSTPELNESGNC